MMKDIIKIFLLTAILAFNMPMLNAQEYKVDNRIDKFVGIWEWKQGKDMLQIVISKQKIYIEKDEAGGGYYNDAAIGWYSYTKDGKIVEGDMNKANTKYATWKEAYNGASIIDYITTDNYMVLVFRNISVNKLGDLKLDLLPNDELKWSLRNSKSRLMDTNASADFTIPKDLILKRVLITVPWQ